MELNFKSYGKGPALIILHGLFGSLDNWVSHARRLEDRYSVYLVDQRNHGKSPHDPDMNYQEMAWDLNNFMDQQGIYHAHLLGHSMGGKTVMQFAGEFPERIDKLIVADIAPKQYRSHHDDVFKAMEALDIAKLSSRQEANAILSQFLPEQAVVQFLMKGIARDEHNGFRWKFNLDAIKNHYQEILKSVDIPEPFEGETFFLSGGASSYVKPDDHEMIKEFFPQARFSYIPGAGHWLHADAPDQFALELNAFLEA